MSQGEKRSAEQVIGHASTPPKRLKTEIPRSPSRDDIGLLGGISLSPVAISETDESSPAHALPTLAHAHDRNGRPRGTSTDDPGSPLRPGLESSISLGFRASQWEPQASPPENLLGRITISDDEEETASEAGEETSLQRPADSVPKEDFTYSFSPNTVSRRQRSLFYDIPSDSDDEA